MFLLSIKKHYYALIFSSHLWVALSAMYGKVLVLLMVAFCLTEVLDNKVRPLTFQVRLFSLKLVSSSAILETIKKSIFQLSGSFFKILKSRVQIPVSLKLSFVSSFYICSSLLPQFYTHSADSGILTRTATTRFYLCPTEAIHAVSWPNVNGNALLKLFDRWRLLSHSKSVSFRLMSAICWWFKTLQPIGTAI